jgi:dsDNA-specific endonuclease/ATPase MutS2
VEQHKKKADHFEATVKIKPKQIFQKIEALKEDNKVTLDYELFKTYPDKVEDNHIAIDILRNAGYKVYDASKIKEHIPKARSVVDLHIEKIMDRHSHLTNAEIIHFQLTEFEKWFELAQLNHLPSLIIIHGVGTGKLKNEIHDLLKVKKGVKSFINQYSDFYGYGATEVFFQY